MKDKTQDVSKSRSFRQLYRELPSLAIKLSRVYEFEINGENATLSNDAPTADTSYLADELTLLTHVSQRIALAPNDRINIDLPPGVTVILGRSGAGKTKLALERMTSLNQNVMYVRHGEPLDHHFVNILATDAAKRGVVLLPFEVDLAQAIASFLFQDGSDVLIVDSLRYLFYAGGGATGKGGVNMTLFADISYLDVVANLRGKSIVLVVNPLTDDDASYKMIVEAAKGSVSALIDVQSPTSIRYTSRYEERDWRNISLPAVQRERDQSESLNAKSARTADIANFTR